MVYNPFKLLKIEPTNDADIINQAYETKYNGLVISEFTQNEVFELNVARQDCLMYAERSGDIDLFSDFDRN